MSARTPVLGATASDAPRPSPLPPAPTSPVQLSDGGAVAMAVAAWLAAWFHPLVPAWLVGAVAVAAALTRRPETLVVAVVVVTCALAARSYAGLQPVRAGPARQVVTLVSDPVPGPFGWRADVRMGRRRVELRASQSAGGALSRALSGERVWVEGDLSPPGPNSPWLVPRHVVGALQASNVERVDGGRAPWRAANRVRRLLADGSEVLDEPQRSLYRGFVLGDARNQPPEIVDDFRGAGLTHLLVVSGQNVAFVLVLISPLSGRLDWRGRWGVTIAVIGAFGTITRFEPSVLRASAMAAIAVTAGALGRPSGSVRTLALAVTGLVMIDPLLVRSIGFQLSVGASLAIAMLAARLAALVPGPRALAEALGVTVAAQFGVAPALIPFAGGLPVASLLANPLAVPVAGLVTTWGLPGGLMAGVGGSRLAAVVHFPTGVMVTWVAAVARIGASLPLGALGWPHLACLAAAAVLGARPPPWRWLAVVAVVIAVATPGLALRHPPPSQRLGGNITRATAGGATVITVTPGAQPLSVMGALRNGGVRRIDVLIGGGRGLDQLVQTLRHRWFVGRVINLDRPAPVQLQVGRVAVSVAPPALPVVSVLPP